MEGKVVYQGVSKNGKPYMIRYPKMEDLDRMLDYMNTISQEQTYISYQGERISREDEEKYLKDILKKIEDKKAVKLVVFSEDEFIGTSDVELENRISSHVGVFGISIADGFRGEGIGKKLMELVLDEAEQNIPGLRIITLGIFSNNPQAYKLYQEFGFEEYGNLPEGVLYKEQYINHLFMFKKLQ